MAQRDDADGACHPLPSILELGRVAVIGHRIQVSASNNYPFYLSFSKQVLNYALYVMLFLVSGLVGYTAEIREIGAWPFGTMTEGISQIAATREHLICGSTQLFILDKPDIEGAYVISSLAVGTRIEALSATDSFVYFTTASQFKVIDIFDPALPRNVGTLDLGKRTTSGLAIKSDRAYVGLTNNELRVISIADPFHPASISTNRCPGTISDLLISDQFLFAAGAQGLQTGYVSIFSIISSGLSTNGTVTFQAPAVALARPNATRLAVLVASATNLSSLLIVDTSNSSAPSIISTNTVLGKPKALIETMFSDTHLVVLTDSGLFAFEMSEGSPIAHSSVLFEYGTRLVTGIDNSLIVADSKRGLRRFRITAGAFNEELFFRTAFDCRDVVLQSGHAYVADSIAGFFVIDASDPSLLRQRPQQISERVCTDIESTETDFFVAGDRGVEWYTTVNRPLVEKLGEFVIPQGAKSVSVSQSFAYVVTKSNVLYGVGTESLSNWNVSAQVLLSNCAAVTKTASLILAAGTNGLSILEASGQVGPRVIGSTNIGSLIGVAASSNYAYAASRFDVFVLDVNDPVQPRALGSFDLCFLGCGRFTEPGIIVTVSVQPRAISVAGDNLFVAADIVNTATGIFGSGTVIEEGVLALFDISNRTNPVFITSCRTPPGCKTLTIGADLIYGSFGAEGIRIFNLVQAPPFTLTKSLGWSWPGYPRTTSLAVAAEGSFAYLATSSAGLLSYEITNANRPVLVSAARTPGSARDVALWRNFAVVAVGTNGLVVVDKTDPRALRVVGAAAGFVSLSADDVVISQPTGIVFSGWLSLQFNTSTIRVYQLTANGELQFIQSFGGPAANSTLELSVSESQFACASSYNSSFGFHIYRIFETNSFTRIGTFGGIFYALATFGNYTYTGEQSAFRTYLGGTRIAETNIFGLVDALATTADGTRLFLLSGFGDLSEWDVQDPTQPRRLYETRILQSVVQPKMWFDSSRLFIVNGNNELLPAGGFYILTRQGTSSRMAITGSVRSGNYPNEVAAVGDFVAMKNDSGVLSFFEQTSEGRLAELGNFSSSYAVGDVVTHSNMVYFTERQTASDRLVNIRAVQIDLQRRVATSSGTVGFPLSTRNAVLAATHGRLFAAVSSLQSNYVNFYLIEGTNAPVLQHSIPISIEPTAIAFEEGLLVVVGKSGSQLQLSTIVSRALGEGVPLGTITLSSYMQFRGLTVHRGRAYVALNANAFPPNGQILTIDCPFWRGPWIIDTISSHSEMNGVFRQGAFLFVGVGNGADAFEFTSDGKILPIGRVTVGPGLSPLRDAFLSVDPLDGLQVHRIQRSLPYLVIITSGNRSVIQANVWPGHTYQLLYSNELNTGALWRSVATNYANTSTLEFQVDAQNGMSGFYRLVSQ